MARWEKKISSIKGGGWYYPAAIIGIETNGALVGATKSGGGVDAPIYNMIDENKALFIQTVIGKDLKRVKIKIEEYNKQKYKGNEILWIEQTGYAHDAIKTKHETIHTGVQEYAGYRGRAEMVKVNQQQNEDVRINPGHTNNNVNDAQEEYAKHDQTVPVHNKIEEVPKIIPDTAEADKINEAHVMMDDELEPIWDDDHDHNLYSGFVIYYSICIIT